MVRNRESLRKEKAIPLILIVRPSLKSKLTDTKIDKQIKRERENCVYFIQLCPVLNYSITFVIVRSGL